VDPRARLPCSHLSYTVGRLNFINPCFLHNVLTIIHGEANGLDSYIFTGYSSAWSTMTRSGPMLHLVAPPCGKPLPLELGVSEELRSQREPVVDGIRTQILIVVSQAFYHRLIPLSRNLAKSLSRYFAISLSRYLAILLSCYPIIPLSHYLAISVLRYLLLSLATSVSRNLAISRYIAISRYLSLSLAISRYLSLSLAISRYLSLSR